MSETDSGKHERSKSEKQMTYDFLCFGKLVYEFRTEEIRETERKIKQGLRYYVIGAYDRERVDYLRALRNDLYKEITDPQSKYRLQSRNKYADLGDFDIERLKRDCLERYSTITEQDMTGMINLAIYIFYLR